MMSETSLPRVVILGSPNVGKSTLFNRLIGRRRTITDSTPGVTRDPVECTCVIDEIPVVMVDTGGYQSDVRGELARIVSEKSLQLAEKADAILFVVDVNQVTPDDEEFLARLRPYSKKTVLVANKTDNDRRDALVWNLHQLGIDVVVGVSAAHGRNIQELKDQILALLVTFEGQGSHIIDAAIKIAVLGKPNTGKSTLVNHLVGEEKSIVHSEPGTTRDVIEGYFEYRDIQFQVLDTAGIRRKTRISNPIESYSVSQAIWSIKRADVVLLLLDATTGLTEQDKKIASLIVNEGKGIVLGLNKWDLLPGLPNTLEAMKDRIGFLFPVLRFAPVVPLSAKQGKGVEQMLNICRKISKQLSEKVPTPVLNQALRQWTQEHPIPGGRANIKIRYAVQISSGPVIFLFFCNRPRVISRDYRLYLINRIRERFGFDCVPVCVEFRQSPS